MQLNKNAQAMTGLNSVCEMQNYSVAASMCPMLSADELSQSVSDSDMFERCSISSLGASNRDLSSGSSSISSTNAVKDGDSMVGEAVGGDDLAYQYCGVDTLGDDVDCGETLISSVVVTINSDGYQQVLDLGEYTMPCSAALVGENRTRNPAGDGDLFLSTESPTRNTIQIPVPQKHRKTKSQHPRSAKAYFSQSFLIPAPLEDNSKSNKNRTKMKNSNKKETQNQKNLQNQNRQAQSSGNNQKSTKQARQKQGGGGGGGGNNKGQKNGGQGGRAQKKNNNNNTSSNATAKVQYGGNGGGHRCPEVRHVAPVKVDKVEELGARLLEQASASSTASTLGASTTAATITPSTVNNTSNISSSSSSDISSSSFTASTSSIAPNVRNGANVMLRQHQQMNNYCYGNVNGQQRRMPPPGGSNPLFHHPMMMQGHVNPAYMHPAQMQQAGHYYGQFGAQPIPNGYMHQQFGKQGASGQGNTVDLPYGVLTFNETMRLCGILSSIIPIDAKVPHGMSINAPLALVIQQAREELLSAGFILSSVRLNGGAAVACLDEAQHEKSTYPSFKDLDIIFFIEGKRPNHNSKRKNNNLPLPLGSRDWDHIRDTILRCLGKLANIHSLANEQLKVLSDTYVEKLVRVKNDHDCWSLISFANNSGRNIELKFVEYARRQYEFSVDSFQIHLDTILDIMTRVGIEKIFSALTSKHFPRVQVESVYGNYQHAKNHVEQQLIITDFPEQIRGGGLLRYCNLLVRGFTTRHSENSKSLERTMCSRFFIDFADLDHQQSTIDRYLTNHFIGEEGLKFDFLIQLRTVLEGATVCLMGMERRDIIEAVTLTAYSVLCRYGSKGTLRTTRELAKLRGKRGWNSRAGSPNRGGKGYWKGKQTHDQGGGYMGVANSLSELSITAAAGSHVGIATKKKAHQENHKSKPTPTGQQKKPTPATAPTDKEPAKPANQTTTTPDGKKLATNGTSSGYASEETTSTHTDSACSTLSTQNTAQLLGDTSASSPRSSCSRSTRSNSSASSAPRDSKTKSTESRTPSQTPSSSKNKNETKKANKNATKKKLDAGGAKVKSPAPVKSTGKGKHKNVQNKTPDTKNKKRAPSADSGFSNKHKQKNHQTSKPGGTATGAQLPPTTSSHGPSPLAQQPAVATSAARYTPAQFNCIHGCHLVYQSVIWALREITKLDQQLEPHCFIELHTYSVEYSKLPPTTLPPADESGLASPLAGGYSSSTTSCSSLAANPASGPPSPTNVSPQSSPGVSTSSSPQPPSIGCPQAVGGSPQPSGHQQQPQCSSKIMDMVSSLVRSEILRILKHIRHPSQAQVSQQSQAMSQQHGAAMVHQQHKIMAQKQNVQQPVPNCVQSYNEHYQNKTQKQYQHNYQLQQNPAARSHNQIQQQHLGATYQNQQTPQNNNCNNNNMAASSNTNNYYPQTSQVLAAVAALSPQQQQQLYRHAMHHNLHQQYQVHNVQKHNNSNNNGPGPSHAPNLPTLLEQQTMAGSQAGQTRQYYYAQHAST